MKCHAVQVQLVLYADLQKAAPIMLRLIFIIIFVLPFLPIACSCCISSLTAHFALVVAFAGRVDCRCLIVVAVVRLGLLLLLLLFFVAF